MPVWRGDGRELYYLSSDRRMMAVQVTLGMAAFQSSIPVVLFSTPAKITTFTPYDVTADGQRFLFVEPVTPADAQPLSLVTNWLEAARDFRTGR